MRAALVLCLALAGCVAPDKGCTAYGILRADMPPLGMDSASEFIAVVDTGMTETCRG